MITEGVHKNISIIDYHSDKDYMSASQIKEANKSLKHLKWYMDHKQERKSHFDFGNAFEIALMDLMNGTKEFESSVHLFDENDRPDKDHKITAGKNQEWKKRYFEQKGYIINKVGDESEESIKHMLESCWSDKVIQGLLINTDYQTSCFWTDKKTGLKLKSRPDVCNVNKTVILDVKTTKNASPESFARDVANYSYDIQAMMQINGVIETGMFPEVKAYYWLAVEKEPPYNAQLYRFHSDQWDYTQMILDYLLGIIKMAKEQGLWTGYGQRASNEHGILEMELPMWYKNKYLNG